MSIRFRDKIVSVHKDYVYEELPIGQSEVIINYQKRLEEYTIFTETGKVYKYIPEKETCKLIEELDL